MIWSRHSIGPNIAAVHLVCVGIVEIGVSKLICLWWVIRILQINEILSRLGDNKNRWSNISIIVTDRGVNCSCSRSFEFAGHGIA